MRGIAALREHRLTFERNPNGRIGKGGLRRDEDQIPKVSSQPLGFSFGQALCEEARCGVRPAQTAAPRPEAVAGRAVRFLQRDRTRPGPGRRELFLQGEPLCVMASTALRADSSAPCIQVWEWDACSPAK